MCLLFLLLLQLLECATNKQTRKCRAILFAFSCHYLEEAKVKKEPCLAPNFAPLFAALRALLEKN